MTKSDLMQKDWEELLGIITGLPNGIPKEQVQAILVIFAKASVNISNELNLASTEIHRFNRSTSILTVVLIVLNFILVLSALAQAYLALCVRH